MLAIALAAAASQAPACRVMAVPVRAGDVVGPSGTVEAPCAPAAGQPKLRYDRIAKVARAAIDLSPGDMLGRVFLPNPPRVLPGENISIAARIGPVTISKDVKALQGGWSDRWLFVRDDAGNVFRAPMPVSGIEKENRP